MSVTLPDVPTRATGELVTSSVWNALAGLVNTLKSRTSGVVYAVHQGVTGNGVTDDSAALAAAAALAVTNKAVLVLPASTVVISSAVTLPAGLTVIAPGTTLAAPGGTGAAALTLTDDVRVIGSLRLTVGGTNSRGVAITGSRVNVDSLSVVGAAPGVGVGDTSDYGVLVSGDDVQLDRLAVGNFDYAVTMSTAHRVNVGHLNVATYVRGLYITDSQDVTLQSGLVRGASPNATTSPGHNGVLIDATVDDATSDVRLTLSVRDAGEHGFRIGGGRRVSRVWFTSCSAVNVGRCGFKVLGGTLADPNRHRAITFADCLVEDAGQVTDNAAGVMIQLAEEVTVTGLVVRRSAKTYSAAHGVEIQASENVVVEQPILMDTQVACYAVEHVLGDSYNVRLVGGLLRAAVGDGVLLNYSGRDFHRVSVEGHPQIGVTGAGTSVDVVNTAGGAIIGGSWLTWQSVEAAGNQTAGLLAGFFCDARAPFAGAPAFRDGSTWTDSASGVRRVRDAGSWKVPVLA